jgi:hypothetical protein
MGAYVDLQRAKKFRFSYLAEPNYQTHLFDPTETTLMISVDHGATWECLGATCTILPVDQTTNFPPTAIMQLLPPTQRASDALIAPAIHTNHNADIPVSFRNVAVQLYN